MKFKESGVFVMLLMLLCTIVGVGDASAMTADVVVGESGVIVHGEGGVNSRGGAEDVTDSLIRRTIEKEVVKIKPHLFAAATVASANTKRVKNSNNPEYEYQSIETLPTITTVKTAYTGSGELQDAIDFVDNNLIAINQTIAVPSVPGYEEDGTTLDGQFLILNVIDKDNSGKPIVVPLNGVKSGANKNNTLPSLPAGTLVVRGARTGTEKQIRTDIFSAVPTPTTQYLQKFIMETEESTYFEMGDKDVVWGKTEITDMALFEHKLTQNTDFWLGALSKRKVKNKYYDKKEDLAWFMKGIWWQAGKDFSNGSSTITTQDLVAMMKKAFVGNASSSTKILFAGSDLIEALQNVQYNQVVYVGSRKQAMGLEFSSIISNYGTLLIYHDQSLNDIGFDNKGLIVDPDYFEKVTMGWREIPLNHKELGTSDSKGQVFVETCALILKNSKAHMRISLD